MTESVTVISKQDASSSKTHKHTENISTHKQTNLHIYLFTYPWGIGWDELQPDSKVGINFNLDKFH